MRPTPLDRLRSAATGTPAAEYALRRVHSRQLTELRDRESSLTARLQETIDGLVSFAGGFAGPGLSGWAVAGGAPTGTVNDRRGGRDVPLFQNEVQLRQYRILARWLCQTNDLAVGFLDLLTNFHLRAGFGWAVTPRGARAPQAHDAAIDPGDVDPDAAAAQGVLDEFRAGDPLTPGTAWRSVAREGFRRLRRDGECFLRLFRGGPDTRGVPAARWVEPEQVGPPDGDTTGRGSFGVLSAAGDGARHLAYFVRDPDGDGQAGRWVRAAGARDHELPAECDLPGGHPYGPGVVVHLRANVDSTVKRGLSDFLPSGETLEQVGRLLDTMGTVAAVQAKIAWIQKYAAGTPAAAVNTQIQQGKDYTRPKVVPGAGPFSLWPPGKTSDVRGDVPGTVLHVDANKEYLPGPVASPAGWIQVEQAMLRAVGVRWAFPEYFSGDASNGNYSSTKEAGSPFVAAVEGGQGDWADFELGVASAVLMLAAAAGRLRAAQVERLAVHVTAPKVVLADPLAEDQRREIQKRNNALSVTEWIRMDGRDPKVTIANLKKEAEELPDAGGQPADLFGGGGAGAGGGALGESLGWLSEGGAGDAGGTFPGELLLLSEPEYRTLAEADRAGLVKRVITNRLGKKQTVWVRAQAPAPKADPRKARDEAHARVTAALAADPKTLTPAKLRQLEQDLGHLTVEQIKAIKRARDVKGGAKKAEHIARLLEHARGLKKGAGPAPRPAKAPPRVALDYRPRDPEHPVAKAIAADHETRKILEDFASAHADKSFALIKQRDAAERAAREAYDKDRANEKLWRAYRKAQKLDLAAEADAHAAVHEARHALAAALKPEKPVALVFKKDPGDPHMERIMRDGGYSTVADVYKPYDPKPEEQQSMDKAVNFVQAVCDGGTRIDAFVGKSLTGRAYFQDNPHGGPDKIGVGVGHESKALEALGLSTLTHTAVHEIGHAIEYRKPGVQQACNEFLAYRLAGEPETDFKDVKGGEQMAGEKGRKDQFDRAFGTVSAYYVGKQYRDKDGEPVAATEVLSMGLEALYRDPVKFVRDDPEYAHFVVSMLRKK